MQTKPLLRDQLIERLRIFILEQRTTVPVRISSERELAEKLSVSRISVRHAIKSLVAEGLLEQKQGSGTYICAEQKLPAEKDVELVHVLMAKDIKRNDPFFNECLAEITHYCTDNAIRLKVSREGTQKISETDKAPFVILGLLNKDSIEQVSSVNGPIVSTQYYPDFHNISQLLFDDSRIGWEAAEILFNHGHRQVIHLGGPSAYPSAYERTEGFLKGAERKNMLVQTLQGKMNWRSGYELGNQVVKMLRSSKAPSAVFASNDWMALGLMHRLAEERVSIPEQLSIIGCDDIHMSAEISPGLSTFKWDMNQMVRELFGIIHTELFGDERSYKRVLLPARFITRDSLGTCKVQN